MPVKRRLIEESIVLDTGGIDQTMHKYNDEKNAILPIDASIIVWIIDANDGR
jgi:hypothetical protein